MKITIYTGSMSKEYVKAFYYLKDTKRIDRIRFFGTNPLYYTYSKIKNFRSYNFKDIFNSYLAPLKILFSNDILVVSLPPYSYKILIPLILTKLGKKTIFLTSWPYWDNKNKGIVNPDKLKINFWKRFLSRVICISVTRAGMESLKNEGTKSFHVPHSIDTQIFKPDMDKKPDKKIRLLYVGRLEEEKGIKELIEVSSKLNPEEFNLLIVGKGKLEGYIRLKQKDFPITYLGYVPDKEKLADIYTKSHVFILNSYSTEKWEEFFGIVLLEAMACGLPVISTDCVGPKEIIEDGKDGVLIRQKNNEDLFNSIKDLIEDRKKRKRLGEEGRKKVLEKYSLEQVSLKLYKILKNEVSKIPFK